MTNAPKATVRYKKVKNAAGYQIKYSAKKNMKGAKTKTTTKVKYTIKKLKSRKFTYVQVRAFAIPVANIANAKTIEVILLNPFIL